jgi:hypothetical protein
MADVNREYLIIPDEAETRTAMESMRGRVVRAAERGERALNFGDIGYVNANRILRDAPHIAEHLGAMAQRLAVMIEAGSISAEQAYMSGAKDLLEILAVATTFAQMPDMDGN